jgi:hypothetical protein
MEDKDKFDILIEKIDKLKDDISEMAAIVYLIRKEKNDKKWFIKWLHAIYIIIIIIFIGITHLEHVNLYLLQSDFLDGLSSSQNFLQRNITGDEESTFD